MIVKSYQQEKPSIKAITAMLPKTSKRLKPLSLVLIIIPPFSNNPENNTTSYN